MRTWDPDPRVDHITLLNRVGQELSLCQGARSGYPFVAQKLRLTLGFSCASLWSIDRKHDLLVKEAMDGEDLPANKHLL